MNRLKKGNGIGEIVARKEGKMSGSFLAALYLFFDCILTYFLHFATTNDQKRCQRT
jgi:hypothetical protein